MKKIQKVTAWLLAFVMVLTLAPAGQVDAASKVNVKKVTVSSSLSGSKKTVVVAKGKKVKLTTVVSVTPNKSANKKVTYTSQDKKIATVDSKGNVKGVKAGSTKITVTSTKNKKKKATIAVKVMKGAVTKVTLDQTSGTLNVGDSIALKATVKAKSGANKTVAWTSSNNAVVTVNSKGQVTAVGAGSASVTAKAIDGSGKKA
ncbi:MAG: Ig domain-containing protein, partial [Lachnospiraceae bacterium]